MLIMIDAIPWYIHLYCAYVYILLEPLKLNIQ